MFENGKREKNVYVGWCDRTTKHRKLIIFEKVDFDLIDFDALADALDAWVFDHSKEDIKAVVRE